MGKKINVNNVDVVSPPMMATEIGAHIWARRPAAKELRQQEWEGQG